MITFLASSWYSELECYVVYGHPALLEVYLWQKWLITQEKFTLHHLRACCTLFTEQCSLHSTSLFWGSPQLIQDMKTWVHPLPHQHSALASYQLLLCLFETHIIWWKDLLVDENVESMRVSFNTLPYACVAVYTHISNVRVLQGFYEVVYESTS